MFGNTPRFGNRPSFPGQGTPPSGGQMPFTPQPGFPGNSQFGLSGGNGGQGGWLGQNPGMPFPGQGFNQMPQQQPQMQVPPQMPMDPRMPQQVQVGPMSRPMFNQPQGMFGQSQQQMPPEYLARLASLLQRLQQNNPNFNTVGMPLYQLFNR